jgi:ribosome-interacting GTPase 1
LIYDKDEDLDELDKVIDKFRLKVPVMKIRKGEDDLDKMKDRLWKILGFVRVYCKEPGKKPEKKPIVLRKGATIRKVAREVHKDFLVYFKFARVWGKSAKYSGQSFGLEHKVEDGDIVELHMV